MGCQGHIDTYRLNVFIMAVRRLQESSQCNFSCSLYSRAATIAYFNGEDINPNEVIQLIG